jgi:2-amino-4-hydroxy-6-hydroxymethyldihydropteridine diphosphokinase
MNRAIVSVGSNIRPAASIRKAREILVRGLTVLAESEFRRTKAEGGTPQPDFLNGAFYIETELDQEGLRTYLREVEDRLGRIRTARKDDPRTIDLDIIVFNDRIVSPDFQRYWFVRDSVLELRPELRQR